MMFQNYAMKTLTNKGAPVLTHQRRQGLIAEESSPTQPVHTLRDSPKAENKFHFYHHDDMIDSLVSLNGTEFGLTH